MATESIGVLIPTAIPGYADSADIQAALRAYHYGSYAYDPANTSAGSLVSPSMAKTIYDIQQDIISLENRPSSGGEATPTQPIPGDFTPPEIPDGFIWVDTDATIGGAPTSATSIFTNSAPTSSLTTGLIWVDKDPTTITANPFIPQAIISAKGDLIVGLTNDNSTVLSAAATNGYILSTNSSTTSGLEWIANDVGDITAVTSGTGISITNSTGPIPTIAIDTAVTATTDNTLTMSNKTLTAPKFVDLGYIADANGNELIIMDTVASAINEITIANAVTSAAPTITASGGDTNISLNLVPKGTGTVQAGGVPVVTTTGTQTLTNKTITSALNTTPILRSPEERWTLSATAATGTVNFDANTTGILYYTSNASGNWTLNIRGDSGTTLNSMLTTNDSITVVFFVTNGGTPYYQTAFQIDGGSVTPKWQNGSAPSAGNANSIDIYSYTIVKTGNATFTAFGSQTKFA